MPSLIDKRTIRTWSMLGQRGTFGVSLLDVAEQNANVYGITADLCKTSGMDRFASKFPDRYINVGIAEQNMIGIAAGLADSGFVPFCTTFANFATLRSNEQVRHFMGYMNSNVKLVGFGAGFAMQLFGNTHYGLEDIAAINAFPNITILSPCDCLSVNKCVNLALDIKGPVYLRLSGIMNNPIVYQDDVTFKVGNNNVVNDGEEVLVYATGSMTKTALDVSKMLQEKNISVKVIDVYSIKPFNSEELLKFNNKYVVTMEEHSINGGLGSIVASEIAINGLNKKLLKIGTSGQYKLPGEYQYMFNAYGLDATSVADKILKFIN